MTDQKQNDDDNDEVCEIKAPLRFQVCPEIPFDNLINRAFLPSQKNYVVDSR